MIPIKLLMHINSPKEEVFKALDSIQMSFQNGIPQSLKECLS